MLDPLVNTIEVPCSQEDAFQIFVQDMGSWWPLEKRAMSLYELKKPPRSLEVDPRLGGRIVEIGDDDHQFHWGTFTAWNPFDAIAMDFHMGLPSDQASLVEVTFVPLGADRTRVTLTHSNWEAFGDLAEMMRNGYGSGWIIIFKEAYLAACGG